MVSEQLIEQYERDGAVCVRGAVDKESANSLFSEYGMKGAVGVRTSQKLSASDLKELRRRLADLGEWARSRHDDAGDPVSFTAVTVMKAR